MTDLVEQGLVKRDWCYIRRPAEFNVAPCACGNADPDWSEYNGRLWCGACAIDFVPLHNGIFDGPIPICTAALLGYSFDRLNLITMKVESFEHSPLTKTESQQA